MRKIIIFFVIALLSIPFGIISPVHAESATITFQNGLDSYSGTEDATISTQYIEWNEIGVTDKTDILRAYKVAEEGKAPYENRALLKFTDLNLPTGALVTDASLTIVVTDWESGYNGTPSTILKGYYFKTPWNIDAANLGWPYKDDPNSTWSAPGAMGAGDIISGKLFTISDFDKTGDQSKTIKLDTEVVQSWVDDPSTNDGILFVNETGDGQGSATIYSAEAATQSQRPKLKITYTLGSTSEPNSNPEPITEPNPDASPTEGQSPTVYISAPNNNAIYQAPAEINFTAMASDPDGTISKVEFYRGTTKVGEDTMEPYLLRLENVTAGEYDFSAVATDNDGQKTGSAAIHITVVGGNQSPTVYISAPNNNAIYQAPAEINFTAMASDPDGTISKVELYRGTSKLGEDVMQPYLFRLTDVSAGEYDFSVVAIDNQGAMTGSVPIHITVEGGNQSPQVAITSPTNNSEFTEPANITIEATASDSDGSISQVDFYRGTQKIGEDSTAPYSFIWQNVGAGDYHLSAVATDNQGAKTGSVAVHIVVNEQISTTPPPSTSMTVGVDMDMCNSAQLSGNLRYVSTSGNDSTADGSINNPYRTVRAAVTDANAGDTVVLRGGTYVEPSEIRIRVPNIIIRSYPGEWAIINSTDMNDIGIYFYVGSDGGSLKCLEAQGGFYTVSTETKWDWGEADCSGASNILLENVKLHDSSRDVVKIKPQSDDITIRHAEIYNSGTNSTPGNCNAEGIDNVNGDRMNVSYTHIHDTCSTGVYFKGGATDGIVEHNLIENTGAAGIILGFDTSPEFFDLSVNPDYYENIHGIARYNLIRNTGWAGIALYASKDAEVYNNTIINASSIYHSPIYFGITFQDWDTTAGRPANVNPSIHHNIVSQPSSREANMVSIRQTDELGGLVGLDGATGLDYNCYYQQGSAASFMDGRTQIDMGGGWLTDWTGNFTEWQSHTNADLNSYEADPGLDSNYKPTNPLCVGMGY